MKLQMSKPAKFFLYFFLILVSAIVLLPLLYTVSASFKTNFEIAKGGINLIPKEFTFENYKTVWGMSGSTIDSKTTFADYTVNSLKVSALTVVIVVVTTAMSAYCFQRGNFPGRDALYWMFLATMFIGAGSVTVYPLLQVTTKLNINNWIGLAIVVAGQGSASNLFLTMGYLKTIPKDLDESAKIDGCTFFTTWLRIILPLSIPILGTIALMTFRGSWNNWMIPRLMLAKDQTATTLVVAIVNLASSGGAGASQYNLMMAGSMLSMAPMLIMFLIMNETFVEGITQGSVKG
ncbi:MAG: carbohydrate ABC transporter permease [Eubacteriales bacterium]|nr:carbohydrate ABC transporter permease [Eubacteriales bacterium]